MVPYSMPYLHIKHFVVSGVLKNRTTPRQTKQGRDKISQNLLTL